MSPVSLGRTLRRFEGRGGSANREGGISMNVKTDREYGIRHLRPNNLSKLRRQMTKQLTALRSGTSTQLSVLKMFGSSSDRGSIQPSK